ncbi:hypothetical protein Sru01_23100 [Sphaerisporangium rufum]|uniref:Uncharacterized protein n=1 Tax=Sphaerisporangium rufum TaxID=1381558 RepID=A0A919R0Y7_9ACTN|nr:CehA/McbA family metallohydrolase [Sphaerisporangium rufum]GII77328.1 hypothetical protein Sru01_23100 [Sphaerisporangium rufum]
MGDDDPMLPAAVAGALERYRDALAAHGMSWTEPPSPYVRLMGVSRFAGEEEFFRAAFARVRTGAGPGATGDEITRVLELDFDEVLRDAVGAAPPDGLAVLRITPDGHRVDGRPRTVLDGRPVPLALLLDNAGPDPVRVTVAGRPHRVGAGGARLVDLDSAAEVAVAGRPVDLSGLTRRAPAARLRLRAGLPCRWSVYGADGQGWYPAGAPPRRDHHGTPYFHGDDLVLDVPAEPLTVRVTRGMEYEIAETAVVPAGETTVELAPARIIDAAARGWYGADLHVHLNYSGDVVATPAMAAAAQHGEDLHVLNLLAANVSGGQVYDREALAHWAGRDLPWSDGTHVARMGAEYRDDLLGHLHAFGIAAPPGRYHAGPAGDPARPPTGEVCEELRALGGVVGYAHTFKTPVGEPRDAVGTGRADCTARAVVVDAALGLVDAMEILHYASAAGSSAVYRRLLGAGNRLAAVAGTDAMLSFGHQRMETVTNPPGWERTYARVDGPLTAAAYAEAVRRGRTFATTGPFLELAVDGHGLGDTLVREPGDRVEITARATGPEVERLEIRTAGGVLAAGPPPVLTAELVVDSPTYVVLVAGGGPHRRSHFAEVFAHTSPVYLDVRGRRVARPADVRWCLAWLELLEELVGAHVRPGAGRLREHLSMIDEARRVYQARLPR